MSAYKFDYSERILAENIGTTHGRNYASTLAFFRLRRFKEEIREMLDEGHREARRAICEVFSEREGRVV